MFGGGFSSSNGVTVSQNVEDVDGVSVKTTSIKDKKTDVTIVENETDGITVTIRTPVKGKEDKVKTIKAESVEELKKSSAEAYRWYKKYASGPAGSVSIQNGDGNVMAGGNAGGFAGGNAGGGAGGFGGGFGGNGGGFGGGLGGNRAGNPAQAMLEEHLRKTMVETNDPVMRAQLQSMLDRIEESKKPKAEDDEDGEL